MNPTSLAAREDARAPEQSPNLITNTSGKRWGATPEQWEEAINLFGYQHLLPTVHNPNAEIADKSSVSVGTRGKVPSEYNRERKIRGISEWTTRETTPKDVERWSHEPDYGICLPTGRGFVIVDFDSESEADREAVEGVLERFFPTMPPTRFRNGSNRRAYLIKVIGEYKKLVLHLRKVLGENGKSSNEQIEFLGTGQQCVIAGTHKTGARIEWEHGCFAGLAGSVFELTPERYAELVGAICAAFPEAELTQSKNRGTDETYTPPASLTAALDADPLARWMVDNDIAGADNGKNKLFIRCPNFENHSDATVAAEHNSGTVYILDTDREKARFHCSHAGCAEGNGNQHDFAAALGAPVELRPARHGEFKPADQSDFEVFETPKGSPVVPQAINGELISKVDMVALSKAAPSSVATFALSSLGDTAFDEDAGVLHRYDPKEGIWKKLPSIGVARFLASLYKRYGVDYNPSRLKDIASAMALEATFKGEPRAGVIGFANGVYDLNSGEFSAHRADNWLRTQNGIEWTQPAAGENLAQHAPTFTKWLEWVSDSVPQKHGAILAGFYMALTNRCDWQMFIEITGVGGSGKGTMMHICAALAGEENTVSMDITQLDDPRGRAPAEHAKLLLFPDQPAYTGNGNGLRAITGGDVVLIDQKHEKARQALIEAVCIVTNNDPMKFTERNGGIERRRVGFRFDKVVPKEDRDTELLDKIHSELPVVIRHLLSKFAGVEGALRAKRLLEKQMTSSEAVAIKTESDPLVAFAAHLEFTAEPDQLGIGGAARSGDAAWNPALNVYQAYLAYIAHQGGKPLAVQAFTVGIRQAAQIHGKTYITGTRGYLKTADGRVDRNRKYTPTNIRYRSSLEEFVPNCFDDFQDLSTNQRD